LLCRPRNRRRERRRQASAALGRGGVRGDAAQRRAHDRILPAAARICGRDRPRDFDLTKTGVAMIGWRARLGFLVPPGNPTVETEMIELAPQGVSLHFHRMMARGIGGALDGQRERNQMMIDHLPDSIELLAMVNPSIIVIAHTATSYHLGRERETALLAQLQEASG